MENARTLPRAVHTRVCMPKRIEGKTDELEYSHPLSPALSWSTQRTVAGVRRPLAPETATEGLKHHAPTLLSSPSYCTLLAERARACNCLFPLANSAPAQRARAIGGESV